MGQKMFEMGTGGLGLGTVNRGTGHLQMGPVFGNVKTSINIGQKRLAYDHVVRGCVVV